MSAIKWVNADNNKEPDLDLALTGQSQGSLITWQVWVDDRTFDYAAILSRVRNSNLMMWFVSGDCKHYGNKTSFTVAEMLNILERDEVRYVWVTKGWIQYCKAPA